MTRTLGRFGAALLGVALLGVMSAGGALAHAEVVTSNPDPGEVLGTPPSRVAILLSLELVDGPSTVVVRDASGAEVARGGLDPADARRLVVELPTLVPGQYRVEWQAVGNDGHNELESGSFEFPVAAAATTEPSPTPTPAPPETPVPPTREPAATKPPAASATAASPSASPAPAPSPSPAPSAGAGDVVIPIVAGLALVAIVGAMLMRRGRRA